MKKAIRGNEECSKLIFNFIKNSGDNGAKGIEIKRGCKVAESVLYRHLNILRNTGAITQGPNNKRWFVATETCPVFKDPNQVEFIKGSGSHKIYELLNTLSSEGATVEYLSDKLGIKQPTVRTCLCRLKAKGLVIKVESRWFSAESDRAEDVSPTTIVKSDKMHSGQILKCLLAFHDVDRVCSIWDIMTATGLDADTINESMLEVLRGHEVEIIGEDEDLAFKYLYSKTEPMVPKEKSELAPLVDKAYFLLKALESISVEDVCTTFSISPNEGKYVVEQVIAKNKSEIKNITISI